LLLYGNAERALVQKHRKVDLWVDAPPGVNKVLIASGLRYDLAVEDPEYVKELATHGNGNCHVPYGHTNQR